MRPCAAGEERQAAVAAVAAVVAVAAVAAVAAAVRAACLLHGCSLVLRVCAATMLGAPTRLTHRNTHHYAYVHKRTFVWYEGQTHKDFATTTPCWQPFVTAQRQPLMLFSSLGRIKWIGRVLGQREENLETGRPARAADLSPSGAGLKGESLLASGPSQTPASIWRKQLRLPCLTTSMGGVAAQV